MMTDPFTVGLLLVEDRLSAGVACRETCSTRSAASVHRSHCIKNGRTGKGQVNAPAGENEAAADDGLWLRMDPDLNGVQR